MNKCLYCYKPLSPGQHDFHPECAKKMFGSPHAPEMPYSRSEMDSLAAQIIRTQTTLTGVQPKLSLNLNAHEGSNRLTIVGLWGEYIFKPQTEDFQQLPEIEDVTMHLAGLAGIRTVDHSLIRLADGSLGYITRRIDRTSSGDKIAMEDFCQLTERPTEYKYRSSYEKIGKTIRQYSALSQLDCVNFMLLLIFCFLTGNNDMHLKNFSLYSPDGRNAVLAPAYDLVNVSIINPADKEELALTLSGKKSNLSWHDFLSAASLIGIPEKTLQKTLSRWQKGLPKWKACIADSFLSEEMKARYYDLLDERFTRLTKDQ